MVVANCCALCLLVASAPFACALAVVPPCGPVDCADAVQCWGLQLPVLQGVVAPVPLSLNCDVKTGGGGWTILQQRRVHNVDFYRNWADYKRGFGTADTFWIGLDNLHRLTKDRVTILRIELTHGRSRQIDYAEYGNFTIGNETTAYALDYSYYNRRSSLQNGLSNHTGPFCCWDTPNKELCQRKAMYSRTSWWFGPHAIINSDLNAQFRSTTKLQQLYWLGVTDVVATQIKFRPSMFEFVAANCSRSCPNGGTCVVSDATFRCQCAYGYTGRRCEASFVPSITCICYNGGTCLSDATCNCPVGYTGDQCEEKIPSYPGYTGGGWVPGAGIYDDPGKYNGWFSTAGLIVVIVAFLCALLVIVFLCCLCKDACASYEDEATYSDPNLYYGYNEQRHLLRDY